MGLGTENGDNWELSSQIFGWFSAMINFGIRLVTHSYIGPCIFGTCSTNRQ